MFSKFASQLQSSLQGNSQQYASSTQQTYNAPPPGPPYVSGGGQSNWADPAQIQQQAYNDGYQANAFRPPPQQHPQVSNQQPPFQRPSQQGQQTHQGFSQPPQHQKPPTQQHQQHQQQGNPQNVAPAQQKHTGRDMALGLGALVAGAVGVDMFMDHGKGSAPAPRHSGGGLLSSFTSHSNSASQGNSGGYSTPASYGGGDAGTESSDYSTSAYGGNADSGGSGYTMPASYGGDDGTRNNDYTTPGYGYYSTSASYGGGDAGNESGDCNTPAYGGNPGAGGNDYTMSANYGGGDDGTGNNNYSTPTYGNDYDLSTGTGGGGYDDYDQGALYDQSIADDQIAESYAEADDEIMVQGAQDIADTYDSD